MTQEEKRDIEIAVMRLIESDFNIDFRQLYDNAVLLVHETLYQAGEEIRNFLEHCGVALTVESVAEARIHLARGKRHLYYGKYVCLLVPVQAGSDTLERKVHAREIKRPVPELRARLEDLLAVLRGVTLLTKLFEGTR